MSWVGWFAIFAFIVLTNWRLDRLEKRVRNVEREQREGVR